MVLFGVVPRKTMIFASKSIAIRKDTKHDERSQISHFSRCLGGIFDLAAVSHLVAQLRDSIIGKILIIRWLCVAATFLYTTV